MDSIIAKTNDGFDKDGVFHNGQTQLLPWPEFTVNGSYFDVFCADESFTDRAATYGNANILPCPYDKGCYYTVTGGLNALYINKYDTTGALVWTHSCRSIWSRCERAKIHHFHDDGTTKWLIGDLEDSSSEHKAYKLSIDGATSVLSASTISGSSIAGFGTLSDGTLYMHRYATSAGNGYYYSHLINSETLEMGGSVPNLGLQPNFGVGNSATKTDIAAPLFNGSVLLLPAHSTAEASWLSCHFAINNDLQFNSSTGSKVVVRTTHALSNSAFIGDIKQLSKDVYYNVNKPMEGGTYSPFNSYHAKFYTRAELEKWVSNSVFAVTGFRIPLSNQGA